jgi:2-methylcitrate dehydratase PrpD
MIPIKEVEQIHKLLIDTFGGSHGIRDPTTTNEQAMQLPGAGPGATIKVN